MSTSEKLVSMLKNIAKRNDVTGYYAARILCDILPNLARLDGVDAAAASHELKETRASINQKIEGKILSSTKANIDRNVPHSCGSGGICRTTVTVAGVGSHS